MPDDMTSHEWAQCLRKLAIDHQQLMLAGAENLLAFPESLNGPLESELHFFVDEIKQSLGLSM